MNAGGSRAGARGQGSVGALLTHAEAPLLATQFFGGKRKTFMCVKYKKGCFNRAKLTLSFSIATEMNIARSRLCRRRSQWPKLVWKLQSKSTKPASFCRGRNEMSKYWPRGELQRVQPSKPHLRDETVCAPMRREGSDLVPEIDCFLSSLPISHALWLTNSRRNQHDAFVYTFMYYNALYLKLRNIESG